MGGCGATARPQRALNSQVERRRVRLETGPSRGRIGATARLEAGPGHVADPAAFNSQVTRASRAFFEAGGFGLQLAGVTAEVSRALADCPDNGERHVLNAGCGEGAYLRLLQREQARRSTLCTALRAAPDRATHTARCTCTALRTALCTVLCIALPSAPPPAGAALGYRREQTCRAVRRPAAQRQPGEGRLRRASTRARGWRLASASGDSRGGCSVRSLTRAPTLIEQVRRQAAAGGAIRGRLTAPTACWERRLGGAMTRCPWPPGADSPGARLRYALGTSYYAAVPLSPMGGSNTATSLHFAAFNAQAQLALCRRLL